MLPIIFICCTFENISAQETYKKILHLGNYGDLVLPEKINYSVIGGLAKGHNGVDNLSDHYKLVKLGSDGVIQWVKRLNVEHIGIGSADPFLCEDGNYLISCDSKTAVPLEKNERAIIKVDTNGNILWSKRYIIDGAVTWYGAELADSYIFCGYHTDFISSDNDVQLLKIDKNGNMLWAKRYGGEANEEGSWILKRKNGNIIVGGTSRSFGSLADFFVFEINGNGDVLWGKVYGGDDEDKMYRILETKNEELICIGYTTSINVSGDIYIIKLTKTGDLIWSKAYDFGGYEDAYYNSALLDTSDNIIFTGLTAGVISTFQDGWFMNINSENGNINSSKVYDTGTDDFSYCVMRDNEHIYTIGTFNETIGGELVWNSYLIKSDFYGNFYCGEIDTMPMVIDFPTSIFDAQPWVNSGGTEDTLIVTITDAMWIDSTVCSCNVDAGFTFSLDTLEASFVNNSENAASYWWSFGDGITSYEYSPLHVYDSAGTYTVTLVGMDSGCLDTMKVTFTIEPTGLNVPNVFTPNGDGANDVFEIKNLPQGAIVNIYNRWGVLIFESNSPNNYWDGRTKSGTQVPGGVYYFIINLSNGEKKKGFVEVVR